MNKEEKKHKISLPHSREISPALKSKLKARRDASSKVWFELGIIGLIGWAVALPTLLGTIIGLFIDNNYAGNISWTLTLLIIGLLTGCLHAWHWMANEENMIQIEQGDHYE